MLYRIVLLRYIYGFLFLFPGDYYTNDAYQKNKTQNSVHCLGVATMRNESL